MARTVPEQVPYCPNKHETGEDQVPLFPQIKVDTPRYCNLRQALQWLKDDLSPVHPEFEPALGRPQFETHRDYSSGKSAIYAALLAGQIKLLGRFGEGPINPQSGGVMISHYGEPEEIPVTRIIETGFPRLNFESGGLFRTTEWEDDGGMPLAGWEYVDLMIPTADLMRVFPPSNSFETPITIELRSSDTEQSLISAALPPRSCLFLHAAVERVANRTGAGWLEAASALHDALCSRQLTAETPDGRVVPCNVWRSYRPGDFADHIGWGEDRLWEADGLRYPTPILTAKSVDGWLLQPGATVPRHLLEPGFTTPEHHAPVGQSRGQADNMPIYLQFLNEISVQLGGRDRIAGRKKVDIEAEIEVRWRPELGQRSQNLVGTMATILRPPEAQRGGAKPMRAVSKDTARQGWNGSIPANEGAAEIETVLGGTV